MTSQAQGEVSKLLCFPSLPLRTSNWVLPDRAAKAFTPQKSHGTIPLGALWLLGYCPRCSTVCSLAPDPCPSGLHLANASSRKPSLRCPPPRHPTADWVGALLCFHRCLHSLRHLGLTARPRAPLALPQSKLQESRATFVLSAGACASKMPGTEEVPTHSKTSYQSLLCAGHGLLGGWKDQRMSVRWPGSSIGSRLL